METMTVFVSQPMRGKSVDEIKEILDATGVYLQKLYPDKKIVIADNVWSPEEIKNWQGLDDEQLRVAMLAKSIDLMAYCNAIYFAPGYREARGCRIERDVAREYGLNII